MAHEQHTSCIEACYACADACDHCAMACLAEAEPQHYARCIALNMDCAQACRTAAAFMARASAYDGAACAFCAMMCDACAEECERHRADHCLECARACRRCARECQQMTEFIPRATDVTGAHARH